MGQHRILISYSSGLLISALLLEHYVRLLPLGLLSEDLRMTIRSTEYGVLDTNCLFMWDLAFSIQYELSAEHFGIGFPRL